MVMQVFGYGRVSKSEQCVNNQLLELRNAGFNIEEDYWYSDVGVSGKTSTNQRPAFQRLMNQIRKNETLVVSKLDRLGRDAIDVLQTVKQLGDRGIKVVVLQLGNTDLTSSAGKLLLMMLSAVAEMERDILVERTQAGLQRAKAEGRKLGRPSKTTSDQRSEIIEKIGQGLSISSIAREYSISRASVLSIKGDK